jgi:small-conductance mechanosensitive channel/CRP-like cAMP-binding protein
MERALAAFVRGELGILGGVSVVIAALLLVALRVVLPPADRSRIRMPLLALLLHIGVVIGRGFLPAEAPSRRTLAVIAVMLLALSIGRSGFLLVIDHLLGRRRAQPLPRIIRDIIQGLVYAGVAIVTLRAAGVEPGSLLATSALLTAVIGLSLQETLGNMFAGLAIQMQRPFEVGDWIQFDSDPEHIGRVVEINWRATKVQTIELVEVIVPNGTLAKAPIANYTKPSAVIRRSVFVQAPYDVPPGRVRDAILAAIRGAPGVLEQPAPTVVTRAFQDSGIEYWVRFFLDRFEDRDVIAGAVRDRIWYAFNRAGISIPFPIRTVHLHEAEREAQKDRDARFARRERVLRCVDFIDALPDEAVRTLADRSRMRRFGAGEAVIQQGELGSELYIIERGEVLVSRSGNGGEAEIARLGPNAFFGEMSLTTGERRTATVRALSECELLMVDKSALHDVLAASPELMSTISEVVASRQVELEESAATSQRPSEAKVEDKKNALLARIRDFFKL